MAVAPLAAWPWEYLGNLKYLLYGPLLAKVLYPRMWDDGEHKMDIWCMHILVICAIRYMTYQFFYTYTAMYFLTRKRMLLTEGVDFKQIDREWNWENFIILQALLGFMACYNFSNLENLPLWNSRGLVYILLLHVGVSEPLYYCIHRLFHTPYLFAHYHSLHHSSPVPQPYTAGHATFLEYLILSLIIGTPIIGVVVMGLGSLSVIYGYLFMCDFLRCLGHSNVEIVSHRVFELLPFLRYLLYTPTYHSLHHKERDSNFCLFMPLYDAIGRTLNTSSWAMHKKSRTEERMMVPDFVFLAHVVDVTASIHVPFGFRGFSSIPFSTKLFLLPVWPIGFISMVAMWLFSKTFMISFYRLRGQLFQTWSVPRFGFQYFIPYARDGINKHIEEAILRSDKLGVKVLGLAALNKNESLNGGGVLFVKKHPNLKVRVVHGNTLTAAVIINEIPVEVKEVFLTGATSKLGRVITLYLCRRGVRVLMLTLSKDRFNAIQKEAPSESQHLLVQVTKYQAAQHCKTWVIGKWITLREQSWAPPGTHFHQFVVPEVFQFRKNCTYGKLAAMRLPEDVEGLGTCEYSMGRGVVHACHAGGVVHLLEGWDQHEVGAIDVDNIDMVWEAALKHGLRPV